MAIPQASANSPYKPRPSELSRQTAQVAAKKVRNRAAPIRRSFVARVPPDHEGVAPPLSRIAGGHVGRGGDVALKLYLSILWFASGGDHDVDKPARSWAQLLDLPSPSSNGARRIAASLAKLAALELIRLEKKPGNPSRVVLLEDTGSGLPYEYPLRTIERLEGAGSPDVERDAHFFFQLTHRFWTDGWAGDLTAAETACLLALGMERRDHKRTVGGHWISPDMWTAKYALSESTRSKGFRGLERKGLVWIGRIPVDPTGFDRSRLRNTYDLSSAGSGLLPSA